MSAAEKPNERSQPGVALPEAGNASDDVGPPTALRALEERTRGLSLEAQMAECIDLLESPQIVVEDLVRSVQSIRDEAQSGAGASAGRVSLVSNDGSDRSVFFYPSRELFVQGDRCSFTCLATEVDFRTSDADPPSACAPSDGLRAVDATPDSPPSAPLDQAIPHAIDYAAVTCESRPFPVLGFTQHSESESAYPILLRALASLIEVTRPRRFDLLDRDVYRGLLGPAPCFDLALVLWDDDQTTDPRRPLCELSRDLAEVLKGALGAEPRFPPVLNDIVCLRMNNKRFDGRLRYVWRV